MAGNKEQRVCVKFCILLIKTAVETANMRQEALKYYVLNKTHLPVVSPFCSNSPRSKRERRVQSSVKIVLISFKEFVPPGQIVKKPILLSQGFEMTMKVQQKWPNL